MNAMASYLSIGPLSAIQVARTQDGLLILVCASLSVLYTVNEGHVGWFVAGNVHRCSGHEGEAKRLSDATKMIFAGRWAEEKLLRLVFRLPEKGSECGRQEKDEANVHLPDSLARFNADCAERRIGRGKGVMNGEDPVRPECKEQATSSALKYRVFMQVSHLQTSQCPGTPASLQDRYPETPDTHDLHQDRSSRLPPHLTSATSRS